MKTLSSDVKMCYTLYENKFLKKKNYEIKYTTRYSMQEKQIFIERFLTTHTTANSGEELPP